MSRLPRVSETGMPDPSRRDTRGHYCDAAWSLRLRVRSDASYTDASSSLSGSCAIGFTARIQALLNSPVNGVVNLPTGTFTISPSLQLKQGEAIVGHNTTLTVAASSGDYVAVLAGATSATDLSGLSITGGDLQLKHHDGQDGITAAGARARRRLPHHQVRPW
jgi:hypothetical protein